MGSGRWRCPATRGEWANSRGKRLSCGHQARSVGPVKLKKISKANTEMHTALIIASSVVGCGLFLNPAN